MTKPDYKDFLAKVWDDSERLGFMNKAKNYKEAVKTWYQDHFGKPACQLTETREELSAIQQGSFKPRSTTEGEGGGHKT